ncbi:MAG: signal peptidase I [Bacteroidota bacterium]
MGNRKKRSRSETVKPNRGNRKPDARIIAKEWLSSLVFAFVAMLTLHTFIFQPFVVPTPSMANTVLPGEYLIVSKLHYGAQTPHTIGIPYTDLYLKGVQVPAFRLPGFSKIKRGDVVVFHLPTETEHPINKRQPYLKRTLGLPGESLAIRDKAFFIDNAPIADFDGLQFFWDVYKTDPRVSLSYTKLKEMGVEEILPTNNRRLVRIIATEATAKEISTWSYVEKIIPYIADEREAQTRLFPFNILQTNDNYGPIWIPKAGEALPLNQANWEIYGKTIAQYEEVIIERTDNGGFSIDGKPVTSYQFKQDYYFMVGDNRDNSLDSRYWGFVPADHILGKAVARFYSWDKEAGWPRFDRMFARIK